MRIIIGVLICTLLIINTIPVVGIINTKNTTDLENLSHFRIKNFRSPIMERMNTYSNKNFKPNQFENIRPIFDNSLCQACFSSSTLIQHFYYKPLQ